MLENRNLATSISLKTATLECFILAIIYALSGHVDANQVI